MHTMHIPLARHSLTDIVIYKGKRAEVIGMSFVDRQFSGRLADELESIATLAPTAAMHYTLRVDGVQIDDVPEPLLHATADQ
jgi:hypothetical protein